MIDRSHPAPPPERAPSTAPVGPPAPTPAARAALDGLLARQRDRFAALDPGLPEPTLPTAAELLLIGSPAGDVAAAVTEHSWPAGSGALLWSAAHVTELFPVPADTGPAGWAALLTAWRDRFSARLHDPDSAAVVTWPSRDVVATRVLLDHGLVPLAVLAVRPPGPPPTAPDDPTLRIRRAGADDLEACVHLALEELAYSSHVGGSVARADAAQVKRTVLRDRLGRGEPTWLAERHGVTVGLLECGRARAEPGSWLATLLPAGSWGYVNCAAVTVGARGTGVGRALLAAALPVLDDPDDGSIDGRAGGGRGTYLYYNPPNPLSSVFWPRAGYRPLWTLWETRPAATLRA